MPTNVFILAIAAGVISAVVFASATTGAVLLRVILFLLTPLSLYLAGLGLGVIAGAIAAAHGGRLHGHASDGEHVELVLELPCVRPPTGRGANA